MNFRKATTGDIEAIEKIYNHIHTCEEQGNAQIGWVRGIYPSRKTAEDALLRGDLFVAEEDGLIIGSAIINKHQVPEYSLGRWCDDAPDDKIMVLHTLVISPDASGMGYGKKFVDFYEKYALKNGCPHLRMDTNERNVRARKMYNKLGYREIGIVPCNFNGIEGIGLVLLEKNMDKKDPKWKIIKL